MECFQVHTCQCRMLEALPALQNREQMSAGSTLPGRRVALCSSKYLRSSRVHAIQRNIIHHLPHDAGLHCGS